MRHAPSIIALPMTVGLALLLSACGGGGSDGGGSGPLTAAANASLTDAYSSQVVQLSGAESRSPGSSIQTYSWTVLSGPAVRIANANSVAASFVVPLQSQIDTLQVRLTVTNDRQEQASAEVSMILRP